MPRHDSDAQKKEEAPEPSTEEGGVPDCDGVEEIGVSIEKNSMWWKYPKHVWYAIGSRESEKRGARRLKEYRVFIRMRGHQLVRGSESESEGN